MLLSAPAWPLTFTTGFWAGGLGKGGLVGGEGGGGGMVLTAAPHCRR